MMIKILMSSTTPIARDGITGVMLNLYKNLNRDQFHIDFVSINNPEKGLKNQFINDGSIFTIIPREIRHPLKYIRQYAKACKGYDIVHVHGNSATMVLEMIAAKISGVKIRVAHSHNTYCTAKVVDMMFRFLFYSLCNVRLACGKEAGEWLFGKRSFTIINNGINAEKYRFNEVKRSEIREQLQIQNSNILVGNVGNFLVAKNHDFLIDVFKELHKLNSKFRLILLGDGNLKEQIEDKVNRLELNDYVYFKGSVNNVSDYLNAIDLIIMPSINEGLPLTLIEEQANGINCVVSDNITRNVDLTGNVEFCDLDKNIDIWIRTILSSIQNSSQIDRNKQSDVSIENIRSKHYDIQRSIKLLEKVYIKCVEENNI